MKSLKNILPVLLIIFIASCSERIDISIGAQSTKLVINAYISNQPSRQTVWVHKTVSYFGGASAPGVVGAQVFLDDVALTANDSVAGEYHTADNFFVAEGQSCTLRVLYDLNGDGVQDEYTATEVMTHSVRLDTLVIFKTGLDTGKYVPSFAIATKFRRNLADDNFTADMYYGNRNMCRTVSNYAADAVPFGTYGADVVFQLGTGGVNLDMGNGDTLRLCPFDTINIRVNSVPRSTVRYFKSAQEELRGSNPMFSGPPANVETNIVGDGVVGCFALRNMSNWRGVVLPMNLKTLDGTWTAQDGSGREISVSDGTATLNGATYFSGVRVDASVKGFWAQKPANGLSPTQFRMNNYYEFEEEGNPAGKLVWKKIMAARRGAGF